MAFEFLKSQLLKVIEWTDDSSNLLVYRFDMKNREIMYGSKLTVRESQVAVFVNKGQIADVFTPGYYNLTTDNLPLLTKILSWKYGFNSPFKAEVYFVNTKQFTDQKWGTANPVMMRDADFGVVRIRGFGKYSFKVDDPGVFLRELFGTNSAFTTEEIANYLKSILVQSITDTIAEQKISALDLAANYREMSQYVAENSQEEFEKLGLKLVNFIIENISLPDDVEKMLDTRTSMGVMGDKMGTYMQFKTAEAMTEAAKNPSGGGIAGAGVGLGAGLGIGGVFADSYRSGMAAANDEKKSDVSKVKCPKCSAEIKADAKFCPECGEKINKTVKCPKCNAEMRADAKFCHECGERLSAEKICAKCGAKIKATAKFCPECGEKTE